MHRQIFNPADVHKLEDPERLQWQPPDEVLKQLRVRPGMMVADIGAGTGYFTIPMARAIGESGKVFAVEVQEQMLAMFREKLATPGLPSNIELIHGSTDDTHLPDGSCDLVLLVNLWHEVNDHESALREGARILRPEGRFAIVDYRPDVTRPPGPRLERRIAPSSVVETFRASGWACDAAMNVGLYSYLVVGAPPR